MASTRAGLRRTVVGAVNLNNCGHRRPVSPAICGPHRHARRVWRSSSRRAVACPVAKTRPVKCPGSGHHTGDRESVLASVDVGGEPAGNAEREAEGSASAHDAHGCAPGRRRSAPARWAESWKARAHALDARGVRRVRPRARPLRGPSSDMPDAGCERKDDISLALLLSSSVS